MATEVARLRAYLDADTRDFDRDMARADRTMGRTSSRGRRAFGALGAAAKTGFLAAGAAVVAGAGYSIKAASDLSESMNAVQVVFGKASEQIFEFGKTAATSAGLSQRAFNEAVTPIGAALQNVGFNAQEAAKQSILLTQRAADMASVFNVDVSESLQAIQAGLRGELDPLEKFGVSLNESALQAIAVKEGIANANTELTAAQKVQARLAAIMDQTNKVQGDFANTSGGLANQQRILKARLENISAEIGQKLIPVALKLTNFLNDKAIPAVEQFGRWVGPKLSEAAERSQKVLDEWRKTLNQVSAELRQHQEAIDGAKKAIDILVTAITVVIKIQLFWAKVIRTVWMAEIRAAIAIVRALAATFRFLQGVARTVFSAVSGYILGPINRVRQLIGWVQDAIGWFKQLLGLSNSNVGSSFGSAAGTRPTGATQRTTTSPRLAVAGVGDIHVNLNVDGEVFHRVIRRREQQWANRGGL